MERGISTLKKNNFSPRILYPAKLSFRIDGAIKVFHNKQKLKYDHQDSAFYKVLCTQKMKENKTTRIQLSRQRSHKYKELNVDMHVDRKDYFLKIYPSLLHILFFKLL
jgi:hypothetical protein